MDIKLNTYKIKYSGMELIFWQAKEGIKIKLV